MDVMRNKFLKIAVVLMGVLLTHTVYGQDLQGAREGLRSYTGHLKESATGQRYDQSSDSWVPEPKGLREKQLPIFEEIKSYVTGGGSNGYLQAPTGIGKTVLFVKAIEGMLEGSSEGKVLIVVPNINLISQVRNEILSFSNFGLDQVGLYYSDISKRNRPHELTKQIVITTYKSFAETTDVFEPNDYVGLILDEVHRGTSELRESKILEFIKNTIVLGFTATPEFNEQKTVNSFLDLILKISVVDAIEKLGLLSNFRSIYYQFEGIDISEADKGRGDFDEIKLGRILDNQEVYEAAIEAYKAYKGLGGEKLGQTVVYCSGIEHAELTAKAFKGAGIEALAIHSGNDMYSGISGEERDKILKAFKAGTSKYKVLVNVNVLVEGFDAPFVRFIINLAPTMSRVIAEQRGGRGLRLIEGLKGLFGRQDKTTLILEFLYSNAKRDKNGKLKQVLYDHLIGKGVSWRKGTKAAYIKSIESEIKTRSERLRKQLSVKKIKIHDSLKAIGAVSKAYTKQEKAGLTYDASGKMMWQGMYIEDLREVAIEIGMTSYQNKGQYKRLVDKLLEGGKTAPPANYWKEMLKDAGMTSSQFYGKDNSTTLGMGFADWFKAGGKLEGFVERGKGLAKQGLTKLKEVFYPEGPGGEDSKRDKSKESKEHGKKEVQAVEKADENKNKPKGSPEEFRQDKKVASGDQPIAKPKANEKGNGSETLNEGAPQKPNAADTPPVEKTLTPEQVEAQKKYEKIKLRFDNAAEEIIKSDAEALESKKMRVKIEQAYQDALKLSVKDRLDKIIAFDSYLKEQSPGSSADKKSFIKSYSGETGKFFAAIWFATFLEIATDSDQDLSYFLETLAHTPTEFLRFMTFSLGAGAGSNVAMGVEGLIAAKLSHTKGLLAYEGALFQKMKVEAGIMGAVAREQAKLMVRNQIGFMAGIMLNKILFEGYTEHFWSELMLEFGSFLGAQLTVKTGTRGAKVLYTLRRYGKVGWKTIKLGSGPGGWIMGMAELGAEIFLAKHFSQMYLHSRAKADGEGELGRNMLRFKRALKGEEDLEAYFPQKAICKQLKGFDLKHCLENVLVQNINAYMLNVIFSKLNFFVANKQLQEQQISDSFGMGHALTDAYFVRKPHIGKNPLAAPYEAAIAKHHTKLADGLKRHMQEIYKTMTPDQNKWMSWLRKQEESIEEIINAACDQDVSDLSDYNHMRRCMGAAEEGIQKMSEHMDLMVQSFGIQRSGLSRFLYRGQPTFVSRYQTIEPKRMIDLSQLLNVVLDYGRDLMLAEDITLEDKEMVSRLMNRVIEDLRTWVGAVTRPEAYQASLLKIEVGVQEPTQLLTVLIDEMAYPGLEDMFKDIKQKYAVDVVDDLLPYVDTQSGTFSIKPESEAQPEFSITIDQAGDTSWKPIVDSQHRLEGIVQKTTAVVLPEGMDVGSVEAMGMVADILVSKITHPEMGESQYTDDSGNMSREMVYERMAEQQRMDGFFKSKIISDMKNNKHVTFIFDQSIESKNTYLDAGLIIQFFSEDTSIETQDPRIQLRYRATMTVPAPVIDALNQTSKAWSNK